MNLPPYAKLAGRLLARAEPAEIPPPSEEVRREAIAAIEAAIIARRRRRMWLRGAGVGALVAAAAVAVLALLPQRASAPQAARLAAPGELSVVALPIGAGARVADGRALRSDGESLQPGGCVVALPRGQALLHFSTGSRVMLDEDSEVKLVQAASSQVVALLRGALRADVAKLGAANRFIVRTSDAEVAVHGTSFRVASVAPDAACGSGTTTRVEVYEGVVSVRAGDHEVRIGAGESWPSDCAPKTAVPVVAERSPSQVDGAATSKTALPAFLPHKHVAPLPTPSELRAQNDMFMQAAAARRAGDVQSSVAKLELLLARYPDGPLSEDAAAQRMRMLRDVDRASAARAAQAYLARHPAGFARAEAQAILEAGE